MIKKWIWFQLYKRFMEKAIWHYSEAIKNYKDHIYIGIGECDSYLALAEIEIQVADVYCNLGEVFLP